MKLHIIVLLLLIASLLTSCNAGMTQTVPIDRIIPSRVPTKSLPPTSTSISTGFYQGTDGNPWWNDAVFYEIFVRSFYDSNGDGIGDFKGILEKLDYLNDGDPATYNDLGITGIWLMPIFPSPSYHGYDVTDYYAVNPGYGTLDDFRLLLKEAHRRGIHIIIDLVLNHTSDQHPWFKASKDSNSSFRNWYIWRNDDPGFIGPWGEKVWHPSLSGYYYGIFEAFMPDLNYDNPFVTEEMGKVVKFWLQDVGVDGFRLDAAKHLVEMGILQENTIKTHKWFFDFRPVYKAINPNAITIGEIYGDDMSTLAGYTGGDQLDLVFNFDLAEAFISSVNTGQASYAANALKFSSKILSKAQYAPFLTNHDQNRSMNQLGFDIQKAKVAASLLLTSPGIPFIYYGEEIGMVGMKPDENIRRPMQWSAEKNTGFTIGKPWRAPDSNYLDFNTIIESSDPSSLLSQYRSLVHLRNEQDALRVGDLNLVDSGNPALYACLRISNKNAVLVLVNPSNKDIINYSLSIQVTGLAAGTYDVIPLFGAAIVDQTNVLVDEEGGFTAYKPLDKFPAYGTLILKLR